jgi:DnaJ-class molecular chaperone
MYTMKTLIGPCGYRSLNRRKKRPVRRFEASTLVLLCFILSSSIPEICCTDPYRTLGVTRNASQKEIQKRYRELCLRYHPDKNSKGEEKFKQVQAAYEMIKSPESRRHYEYFDATGSTSSGTANRAYQQQSYGPYGSDPLAEALFRAFGGPAFASPSRPPSSFFSGGQRGMPSPPMPAEISFRSIYVQKVKVPLEELYRGVTTLHLDLRENLWTRYRAAWRGKVLLLSLYQGLMYSTPFWRASKIAAAIVALFVSHLTVPRPDPGRKFSASLKPGSKGGKTTVRFASTTYKEPEIVFEIEEDRHPIYARVGNDLHTSVTVSTEEAEEGCMRRIPALDPSDPPIELVIPPGKFMYTTIDEEQTHQNQPHNNNSHTIRVRGRGWPIRHAPDVFLYGDLVVTVIVQKPPRRQRKRRKNSAAD